MYIHAQRMTYPVREERTADSTCENSIFGIPRTACRGIRRFEDPETLESFNESTVTMQLDVIPVQTRSQNVERKLIAVSRDDSIIVWKTNLLHLKNKFINSSRLRCKFSAISNRHRPSDVRRIAIPFASRIDQEYLWYNLLRLACRERVDIMMVVGFHRSPSKFLVIAAIMKCRSSRRRSYYGEVRLVYGSTSCISTDKV